jgi:hypothetical protein
MSANAGLPQATLQRIARRLMIHRGLLTESSVAAKAELGKIQGPPPARGAGRDLRAVPF